MASVLKVNDDREYSGLLCQSPHGVVYEEDLYPTAAHLFEAHRFLDHRPDLADRIRQCKRVEEVIAVSAELARFTRQDWGNVALVAGLVSDLFFLPVFRNACVLATNLCQLRWVDALDGRCIIPQVPPAQRPGRVAS
jgi:hypothetical protein